MNGFKVTDVVGLVGLFVLGVLLFITMPLIVLETINFVFGTSIPITWQTWLAVVFLKWYISPSQGIKFKFNANSDED